jgi:hypothetical protein
VKAEAVAVRDLLADTALAAQVGLCTGLSLMHDCRVDTCCKTRRRSDCSMRCAYEGGNVIIPERFVQPMSETDAKWLNHCQRPLCLRRPTNSPKRGVTSTQPSPPW